MPKLVTIEPNPAFKPSQGDAKTFAEVKKAGAKTVAYQTAMQNIRLSGGMYRLAPEKKDLPASTAPSLEDMPLEDLKVLMLQVGVKTDKQMKRSEVISLIRKKLSVVEVIDDQEEAGQS